MGKYTFEAISEEAKENRNYFLNSFKSYRFNSALKHGFTAAALSSVATGATASAILWGGGGISFLGATFITLPFIALPLFVPVIAGIAAIIITSFLAGMIARYLYTPSKVYSDFYKEFESDKNGLFIDTYNKEKDGKNPLEKQNAINKTKSIREWEAICNFEKKTQSFWEDENKIKKRYKERFFQALKQDNKKLIEILSNNRFLKYITKEKDGNNNTLFHLAAQKGYTKLVRVLIQNIENEDEFYAENIFRDTPLELAKREGHKDIVRLIEKERKEIKELFAAANEGNFKKFKNIKDYQIKIKSQHGYKNSLLHWAATNEKRKTTKKLIDKGADLNAKNDNGDTPLQLATCFDDDDIVELFIENYADIYSVPPEESEKIRDEIEERKEIFAKCIATKLKAEEINTKTAKIQNKDGNFILHVAAITGKLDVVKKLIKKGANVNATNKELETPLHWAVVTGQLDVIKELFKQGANVNAKDINGDTPLHFAASTNDGKLAATIELLIKNKKTDINVKDKNKKTPLHVAVEAGNKEATEILLKNGADISKQDINGNTPLHSAIENNQTELIPLLIQNINNEADLNAKNGKQQTPLELAESKEDRELINIVKETIKKRTEKINPQNISLHLAAYYGNEHQVKSWLKKDTNPNLEEEEGKTPLHFAARNAHKGTVEILLNSGSNVIKQDINGDTPLHFAAIQNSQKIVKILINYLKNKNDINIQNYKGNTPLHRALNCSCNESSKVLIYNNANLKIVNEDGNTPLHLAFLRGDLDIAEKIIKKLSKNKVCFNVTNKQGKNPFQMASEKTKDTKQYKYMESQYSNEKSKAL